ncbi:MAG: hypothetical protein IJH39_10115 [Clostridia bacterium]|nr:hypothetical protein [Clostridia bacterium]
MEIFDKIGKKATEAYKITTDKTGKIAKETKLKIKMNNLKSDISDIYEEIGKRAYEKHNLKENVELEKYFEQEFTEIDVLSEQIDSILKEILELKDKKQCEKCFTNIDKECKFCPNCGAKQEEANKVVHEVEVVNNDNESEN